MTISLETAVRMHREATEMFFSAPRRMLVECLLPNYRENMTEETEMVMLDRLAPNVVLVTVNTGNIYIGTFFVDIPSDRYTDFKREFFPCAGMHDGRYYVRDGRRDLAAAIQRMETRKRELGKFLSSK